MVGIYNNSRDYPNELNQSRYCDWESYIRTLNEFMNVYSSKIAKTRLDVNSVSLNVELLLESLEETQSNLDNILQNFLNRSNLLPNNNS